MTSLWDGKTRKSVLGVLIVFALSSSTFVFAQRGSGGGGGGTGGGARGTTNTPRLPPAQRPTSPAMLPTLFFDGVVLVEGGMAPPDRVNVTALCTYSEGNTSAQTAVNARTDSDGAFAMTVSFGQPAPALFDASESMQPTFARMRGSNCEFTVAAPGYLPAKVMTMLPTGNISSRNNLGVLMIRPLGAPKELGGAVSMTTLQAPDKARKELQKGTEKAAQNKKEDAEKHLRKAVEIYPKYAMAWVALGEIQEGRGEREVARASYQQALDADSHFVTPLVKLAMMAAADQKWSDARQLSERAIAADPVHFATAYFLNAVANYNLGHIDVAEKSGVRALDLDKRHAFPRMRLLMAEIYQAEGKTADETKQLEEFVSMAPDAPETQKVRARLTTLQTAAAR